MVQTEHNQQQILMGHSREILDLGDVLADQSIHIFIRPSLPGSIRMGEKEIDLQGVCNPFVIGKPLAIIRSEALQTIRNRVKQLNDCITRLVRSAMIDLGQQAKARLAFGQGYNGITMPFANESVHSPVSNSGISFNDGWTLIKTHPVGYFTTPVITTMALPPLHTPSFVFVSQNILVDLFMINLDRLMAKQPNGNLLRAPIKTQLHLNQFPQLFRIVFVAGIVTTKRFVMGLLRSVATLPLIPLRFATHGRFVFADYSCNLSSVMSHFQQRIYLVSLFLGKPVEIHKRSFDLAVLRFLSTLTCLFQSSKLHLGLESPFIII